jgi:hypothetical protein
MEKIITSLKTPEWWFTACFVAVLSSVVAAFVREWISIIGSRYSVRMRRSRWRINRMVVKAARLVTYEPILLAAYGIVAVGQLIAILLQLLVAFTAPLLAAAMMNRQAIGNATHIATPGEKSITNILDWMFIGIAFGGCLAGIRLAPKLFRSYKLFYRAYRILRRRAVMEKYYQRIAGLS